MVHTDMQFLPNMPRAHYWRVYTCASPDCPHPHLVAFDEKDRPLANIVIGMEQIDRLRAELRGAAAFKATGGK